MSLEVMCVFLTPARVTYVTALLAEWDIRSDNFITRIRSLKCILPYSIPVSYD